MMNWLKDAIGINKYVLAWRVPYPHMDWVMSGRSNWTGSKRMQTNIANDMNKDYGDGTHWIERA